MYEGLIGKLLMFVGNYHGLPRVGPDCDGLCIHTISFGIPNWRMKVDGLISSYIL